MKKIYSFIISIYDKRLSSFFILFYLFPFTLFFFFPLPFSFNFVVSEQNVHSFLPTYLGGTSFPLLDVSERNFFFRLGGGARAPSALPLRTRLMISLPSSTNEATSCTFLNATLLINFCLTKRLLLAFIYSFKFFMILSVLF